MKTHIPLPFRLALVASTAIFIVNASAASAVRDATVESRTALPQADRHFIETAVKLGLEEVEISRVAAERTSNPKVRELAQALVSEHEITNDTLSSIAVSKNVSLPAKGTEANTWMKKNAKGFDEDYLGKIVSNHEDAVKLYEKEAKDGQDLETLAFARKVLPKLQTHLQHANDLKRALK